jgi:hypothetical protein
MKVTVTKDNTATDYFFSPEHKAEVIGWYTKEYWSNKIQGFIATLEDGTIVAIGAK